MYELAPATKILATHCAACARPLLDAESVEAGLGPECRKRYGVPKRLPEEVRRTANVLVYRVAREDATPDDLAASITELAMLGCDKLADRIAKRAGAARITLRAGEADVAIGYSEQWLRARRSGRWVAEARVTRYRRTKILDLAAALSDTLPPHRTIRVEEEDGRVYYTTLADLDLLPYAEEDPEPALLAFAWTVTPSRLPDGSWGVCWEEQPEGDGPKEGDVVRVRTRGGSEWTARLGAYVTSSAWGWIFRSERLAA